MNRRKFLERAGTGTLALGSVPLLAGKAWGGQSGQDRGFRFVVDSFGPGTDRLLFSGDGHFDLDGHVEGGGNFDHFQAMMGTPAPLVSTGTWKASQFVSFTPPTVTATPMGTHGVY